MTAAQLLDAEKSLGQELDELTASDYPAALEKLKEILTSNEELFDESRAASARLARLACRVLLHRKSKDKFVGTLISDSYIRSAFFGRLNTNKYSIVFAAKRIFRRCEPSLAVEIIELIKNNPWRDDASEDYSDRFSWSFISRKILEGDDGYLTFDDEIKSLLRK